MADSVARRPHTATSVRGLVSPPSPILPSSHPPILPVELPFTVVLFVCFFPSFFFFSLLSSSHFLHFPTPRLDDSCHHSTSILRSSSLVFFPLVTPFIDVPLPPSRLPRFQLVSPLRLITTSLLDGSTPRLTCPAALMLCSGGATESGSGDEDTVGGSGIGGSNTRTAPCVYH